MMAFREALLNRLLNLDLRASKQMQMILRFSWDVNSYLYAILPLRLLAVAVSGTSCSSYIATYMLLKSILFRM